MVCTKVESISVNGATSTKIQSMALLSDTNNTD
eukprot:COSAG01_NODE_36801_length_512_cov_1.280872_2_plen_32_part_01